MKRDPDTGEFKVNGRSGAVLAVLRAFQPALVTLFVVVVVPLSVWHFRKHEDTAAFMIQGNLRFDRLELDVAEIKSDTKIYVRELSTVSAELSAIRRILEN